MTQSNRICELINRIYLAIMERRVGERKTLRGVLRKRWWEINILVVMCRARKAYIDDTAIKQYWKPWNPH